MKAPLDWYYKLCDQFAFLSTREKVLFAMSGLIFIVFGGFVWLVEPIQLDNSALKRRVDRQNAELSKLEVQIKEVEQVLQQDPDAPLRESIALLRQRIIRVDADLREQTVDLIPAEKMPLVLERILERSLSLQIKIVAVNSIAPIRMMNIDSSVGEKVNLFQHGIALSLEGSYMDVLQYLEEIENLEWRFYWKSFDYKVEEYPLGKAEIELYTLSTSQAFIGV